MVVAREFAGLTSVGGKGLVTVATGYPLASA